MTVRRLMPIECARLQGFPDYWCSGLEIPNPTEEEMNFWHGVFETYRIAIDPNKKPKTENQIRKWLKSPHSDSAEYKMWGNSLTVQVAYNILAGIAEILTFTEE